jgi:hypothetical protein
MIFFCHLGSYCNRASILFFLNTPQTKEEKIISGKYHPHQLVTKKNKIRAGLYDLQI